ncbi:hypothetical protein [Halorhodospira halophila]|uniref:Lipoprotein n=1 Tax=Halorhodospira halophila (strain DSM 244 / SL1) TaxID=349124 RepID=A1WYR5_HALHL|nr:hypothetical protein [Halorhodospira halophila]ABM62827.1 hypothetical protein Hhal_2063 [Halorhodospira halophila SL1]
MSRSKVCRTLFLGTAAAAVLGGCELFDSSSDQDTGSSTETFTGRAVDGPIAGGRVYLDRSETGWRGSFDPSVRTGNGSDTAGEFSLEAQVEGLERVVLRVADGRDQFHGLRVPVTLSRDADHGGGATITPITALLTDLSDDQRTGFLNAENREGDLDLQMRHLTGDYLDFGDGDYSDAGRLHLIRTGYQAQKLVEVVAAWLEDRYADLDGDGVPADAGHYVYPALAEHWVDDRRGPSETGLEDFIRQVVETAEERAAAAVGKDAENDLPNKLVDHLKALWEDLIGGDNGLFGTALLGDDGDFKNGFEVDDVAARARAIEAATRVLRGADDDSGVPDHAEVDFDSIVEHLTEKEDYSVGDNGDFSAALDVVCYQEKLGEHDFDNGNGPDASQCKRGKFDFNQESPFTLEDDDDDDDRNVSIKKEDDDTLRVEVDLGDDGAYSGTAEQLDDYTLSLNTELAGQPFSGTVRRRATDNDQDSYEFEFAGQVYQWSVP